MGSGKPEAVQLSTSSSPSFAVIFESWRISGGTVNNAKDATNPQLASFSIHKLKTELHAQFLNSRREGTPLYGLYRYVRTQKGVAFSRFDNQKVSILGILTSNRV